MRRRTYCILSAIALFCSALCLVLGWNLAVDLAEDFCQRLFYNLIFLAPLILTIRLVRALFRKDDGRSV